MMMRVKGLAGFQYTVGKMKQFAHDGANNGHFGLTALSETLM